MILESAFLKLPELLTSNFDHYSVFESTAVHFLATAIRMEFTSRSIPQGHDRIFMEKVYPFSSSFQHSLRADLFIDTTDLFKDRLRMELYGEVKENWIEVKTYFGSARRNKTSTKTKNAGEVLSDLLRLCLFPDEVAGGRTKNNRYFTLISSNKPNDSLALQDQSREERKWLTKLLSSGTSEIHIIFSELPETLKGGVGDGFKNDLDSQMHLEVDTLKFEPGGEEPGPVFWGYLNKINSFRIETSVKDVSFVDGANEDLSNEMLRAYRDVRNYILEKM